MNFLREYDISDNVIRDIRKYNDKAVVQMLIYDEENVGNVIEYLRNIGIEVIDEMLINRPEIFSIKCNLLIEAFNKYDLETLVNLINEDINAINFI